VVIVAIGTLVALAPNLSAAMAGGRTRVAESVRPVVPVPGLVDEPEAVTAGRSRD
jgi:hypothetical protein